MGATQDPPSAGPLLLAWRFHDRRGLVPAVVLVVLAFGTTVGLYLSDP